MGGWAAGGRRPTACARRRASADGGARTERVADDSGGRVEAQEKLGGRKIRGRLLARRCGPGLSVPGDAGRAGPRAAQTWTFPPA